MKNSVQHLLAELFKIKLFLTLKKKYKKINSSCSVGFKATSHFEWSGTGGVEHQ